MSRSARYAVIGHPVAHSLSPRIHALFAAQLGEAIDYGRLLAPLDGFAAAVDRFVVDGGAGLNVTVPFKLDAHALCGSRVAARARRAGAVNWLAFDADGPRGDNTDGTGLVIDLQRVLGRSLAGVRVLLVGAGGAARGVLGPLLDAGPQDVQLVNRDPAKAEALAALFDGATATTFDALRDRRFDVVVNATSASLADAGLPLPPAVFVDAFAYDLMYGAEPTRFVIDARRAGAVATADGLGMLVEQAAESFRLWRGTMPETAPVRDALRASLSW